MEDDRNDDRRSIGGPGQPLWLMEGDCLDRMRVIPDGSVNLIISDGPYHNVKQDTWDRQWKTPADFLAWMGRLCEEWRRVLAPNGSLYVFASPRMAARVECKVGEWFEVLNRITWVKSSSESGNGQWSRAHKEGLRSFFPRTEAIIFAEHPGADSMALGESGYAAKCDELRGFVFEPLRQYLRTEMIAAGLVPRDINRAVGSSLSGGGMATHYVGNTPQWELPTEEHYHSIRSIAPSNFRREYESLRTEYESLRTEYESLRTEYESLRRPFTVSAEVPYTDVWDFPTVPARPGKHSCQKPEPLYSHIIQASSRPGDVVLDPFLGSGVSGEVARSLGRSFVGIEQDPKWFGRSADRIGVAVDCGAGCRAERRAVAPPSRPRIAGPVIGGQLSLFDR